MRLHVVTCKRVLLRIFHRKKNGLDIRIWIASTDSSYLGCRHGPYLTSNPAAGSCVDETFSLVDRDGSGNITLSEYLSYVNWTQDGKLESGGKVEALYIKHFHS